MAELAAKFADSTFVVEQNVESVPEAVPESISTSETAGKELKEEDHMTEVTEPQESIKTEDLAASKVPENSVPVPGSFEESLVLPAEESEEVNVEPPVAKEAVPETVNESKAVDTIVPKSDHPTLFQKVKKAFEFPKSHKSKESPAKEVPAKEPEADVEPAPVAEAESAALASSVTAEPEVMSLAAATPEAKPAVSEKASEKVSEGKGFFNKVKKSFFTKSYSFSGSIPDSKLGVAPAAPPPAIAEVRKQADTVSAVEDTETPASAAAKSAGEATLAPAAADLPAATGAASTLDAETVAPDSETERPAADELKEGTSETVDEKAVVKEDKPKNNFFQKIVRRLLPKNSHNSTPSAAPAVAHVVAASA